MQHINLFSQLDRVVTPPLAAKHQAWLLLAVVVLMLTTTAAITFSNNSLSDELKRLQQQANTGSAQVEILNAKKAKLLRQGTMDREIEVLQGNIVFRRKLLAFVDKGASSTETFAEHLAGLARQSVKGMWFTEIQLRRGGQQLVLLGSATKAELLPRYLQGLSNESLFSGHQFRIFRMSSNENRKGLLDFELRADDSDLSSDWIE